MLSCFSGKLHGAKDSISEKEWTFRSFLNGVITMKNKYWFLLTIMIFSFIFSVITIYSSNYKREVSLALKQIDTNKNFIPFKIPVNVHSQKEFRQIITALNVSAKKNNLNYMLKQGYIGYPIKNGKLFYAKSIQKQNFYVYDLYNSHLLENFGKMRTRKNTYTYTYPLLANYQVTVQPLKRVFSNKNTFESVFFLETLDSQRYLSFITQLNLILNQKLGTHYSIKDYQITRDTELLLPSFEIDPNLLTVINYLEIFIFVSLVIFFILQWHELKICKINGLSFLRIFIIFALKPLLMISAPVILDFYAYYKRLNLSEVFIRQLNLIGISFCVAFIILLLMYLVSLNDLKERYFTTITFLLMETTKLFLLITLIASLVPIGSIIINSYNNRINTYIGVKRYVEFFPRIIGNNAVDEYIDPQELNIIYRIANKQGALLFDDSSSNYIQTSNISPAITYISLNNNYLKKYPLRDIHNKKITINSKVKKTVLIFPTTKKKLVTERLKYEYSSSDTSRKYGVKIIYSDPKYNQRFRSILTGNNISDEIIKVITPNNLGGDASGYDLNILTGLKNDYLLLPQKYSSLRTMEKYWRPILKKYNLSDNFPQLIYYEYANAEELRISLGNLFMKLFSQIFLLLTVLALSFYSLLSFFKKNAYALGIKKAFGYSRFRNYWPYWALMVLQYSLTPLFANDPNIPKEIYFTLVCFFFGVELIIMNCFISYLEREALKNVQ